MLKDCRSQTEAIKPEDTTVKNIAGNITQKAFVVNTYSTKKLMDYV